MVNKSFLNTKIEITRQLMRTAGTLEAETCQVLRRSVSTAAKEDESCTGLVSAAGLYLDTVRSRLGRVLNLIKR
jgi:hypothetical protein